MKTVASIVALIVAFGFVGTPDACADTVSGRVVQVAAGATDLSGWTNASVLGRRTDGTYWLVFISNTSISPTSANRLLTAASANHGLNQATISGVIPSFAGSTSYYYANTLWFWIFRYIKICIFNC